MRAWGQETDPRTALHEGDLVGDENPPCSALAKSDREKGTEFSKCKSERKRDTNRSNTASAEKEQKKIDYDPLREMQQVAVVVCAAYAVLR